MPGRAICIAEHELGLIEPDSVRYAAQCEVPNAAFTGSSGQEPELYGTCRPGPYITFPGFTPVCLPFSITTSPLTNT